MHWHLCSKQQCASEGSLPVFPSCLLCFMSQGGQSMGNSICSGDAELGNMLLVLLSLEGI